MNPVYQKLLRCYESVQKKFDFTKFTPGVAIVLGSGLGDYADDIEVVGEVDYHDIEGFPVSTVPGHAGKFIFGYVGDVPVVCMKGRVHYYEGYPITDVVLPTRLMKLMGAKILFLTNACGGINPEFKAGDFMLIEDQISVFAPNPLIGENIDELGTRFPDMSHVYDEELREIIRKAAKEKGIELKEGVYCQFTGPSFESPAEIRMAGKLGADAAGMSTVPEVIVARHSEIPVFGMSVITNAAQKEFAADYKNDGDDVVKAADAAADKMTYIFTKLIEFL